MDFVIPVALELVAADADLLKFLVAYLAPLGILAPSSQAWTSSPFDVRVEPIRFTTTSCVSKGTPCQLRVMWQNNRCSILFHLLVPGGK